MALKIKISEVQHPIVLAMGGEPITQDFYARFIFSTVYKGFDMKFSFRFFFDTMKEDEFASLDLILNKEQTVIVYDESGADTGKTEKKTVKHVVRREGFHWQTLQPLTGQINTQANAYYEQIKDVPQIVGIVAITGENAIKANIGTHIMAKHYLEQVFGENSVEIDLFLQ